MSKTVFILNRCDFNHTYDSFGRIGVYSSNNNALHAAMVHSKNHDNNLHLDREQQEFFINQNQTQGCQNFEYFLIPETLDGYDDL